MERERERDSFGLLYTGYLLFIVKIKRDREKDKKREERERECDKKVWPKVNHMISRDLPNQNLKKRDNIL